MKRISIVLLLSSLWAAQVQAQSMSKSYAMPASSNKSQDLGEKTFGNFISHLQLAVVHFFDPASADVESLAQTQAALKELSNDKEYLYAGLAFVKADLSKPEIKNYAQPLGVSGPSTIVLFNGGKPLVLGTTNTTTLTGYQSSNAIKEFIEQGLGSSIDEAIDKHTDLENNQQNASGNAEASSEGIYTAQGDDSAMAQGNVIDYNADTQDAPYWIDYTYNPSPAWWSWWPGWGPAWFLGGLGFGYWWGTGWGWGGGSWWGRNGWNNWNSNRRGINNRRTAANRTANRAATNRAATSRAAGRTANAAHSSNASRASTARTANVARSSGVGHSVSRSSYSGGRGFSGGGRGFGGGMGGGRGFGGGGFHGGGGHGGGHR